MSLYLALAKVASTVKSRPFTPVPRGSSSLHLTSKVAFYFSLFWFTESLPISVAPENQSQHYKSFFCVLTMSQAPAIPGLGDWVWSRFLYSVCCSAKLSPPTTFLPCLSSLCTRVLFRGVCPLAIQPSCSVPARFVVLFDLIPSDGLWTSHRLPNRGPSSVYLGIYNVLFMVPVSWIKDVLAVSLISSLSPQLDSCPNKKGATE